MQWCITSAWVYKVRMVHESVSCKKESLPRRYALSFVWLHCIRDGSGSVRFAYGWSLKAVESDWYFGESGYESGCNFQAFVQPIALNQQLCKITFLVASYWLKTEILSPESKLHDYFFTRQRNYTKKFTQPETHAAHRPYRSKKKPQTCCSASWTVGLTGCPEFCRSFSTVYFTALLCLKLCCH